jgi:hypothetical protein
MEPKESIRTRILVILLEKLVLVFIIAAAGFGFNYLLQQEKTRGEYQKQIFDRRVQSYVSLLEEAKRARDQLAVLYGAYGENQNALGELSRKDQLETLSAEVYSLHPAGGTMSRWDDAPFLPVLESLSKIEQITRENDLYISQDVKDEVGNFLDVLISDLDPSLKKAKAQMQETGSSLLFLDPDPAAWKRAEEAYLKLLQVIKSKLQIEGIPLG